MTSLLASAVVAALVSGVVTLLLPFAQWRVKKLEEQRAHRRTLLATWRQGLADWNDATDHGVFRRPPSYIGEQWYLSLRSHLTPEEREEIERHDDAIHIDAGSGQGLHSLARPVVDVIDRVERRWGLG